jgi:hypothetical protein
MTSSPAILHYRQIFDSRSPEQMRVLAHIKRFMERLTGDDTFRAALAESADDPRDLARRFGIDVAPSAILPLWHARYRPHRRTPECAPWPLAVAWDEYMTQMLRHRDLLREEGDMQGVHPRFQAWRNRQMQRCAGELGDSAAAITHPIISFELSDGCSGLLEEDFDDSFAGAQNEGLILRARTLGRKFATTDAAHADPA